MPYFPDLSVISYNFNGNTENMIAIGWLDPEYNYIKGSVTDEFMEKLWKFCYHPMNCKRGYYTCGLGCTDHNILLAIRNDKELELGNGEIRVFGDDGSVYTAPTLIYHYVVKHNYLPPDAFVNAVLATPLPTQEEYNKVAYKYIWYQEYLEDQRLNDVIRRLRNSNINPDNEDQMMAFLRQINPDDLPSLE